MRGRTAGAPRYTRKSNLVDTKGVSRARRALGVAAGTEAVRLALARVVESKEFWRFMAASRGRLQPGSLETP
jgi:hypothetical protein